MLVLSISAEKRRRVLAVIEPEVCFRDPFDYEAWLKTRKSVGAVINIDTATIGGWWALCGPYEFTDCRFVDEAPDNGDLDKPYHYEPSGSEMNGSSSGWV